MKTIALPPITDLFAFEKKCRGNLNVNYRIGPGIIEAVQESHSTNRRQWNNDENLTGGSTFHGVVQANFVGNLPYVFLDRPFLTGFKFYYVSIDIF